MGITRMEMYEMPGFSDGTIIQREQDGCIEFFLKFPDDEKGYGPYDIREAIEKYVSHVLKLEGKASDDS